MSPIKAIEGPKKHIGVELVRFESVRTGLGADCQSNLTSSTVFIAPLSVSECKAKALGFHFVRKYMFLFVEVHNDITALRQLSEKQLIDKRLFNVFIDHS